MLARYVLLLLLILPLQDKTVQVPEPVQKLLKAYPDHITGYKDNYIIFKDGTKLPYDDGRQKSAGELLNSADVEDQFKYDYKPEKRERGNTMDPGRIRNEDFFKRIYGFSAKEVEPRLVTVTWCPKLVNQKIRVTTVNGLDKIVTALSNELDRHPEFKPYVTNIGGTYNWRKISGTDRLSAHSFGCTIDINVKYSDYWQWQCKCKDEGAKLVYKNRIPESLVAIFEKYGFIWGGKWYHFDTMHFEYRPELLL
ncbi:MAG: hypothetical protein CFE23_05805 [Flavobacterium sp. BFFFF1]|uniref:M15 family metallopeptidase n=1 Tax=Flavobacterium sp. BFFFF1 TaxID=2015557 RepID=UPI000BDD11A3|nr:M15 family metallopeptidase [Flavobacterium sp. BFFFF1]OYU81276.1 MAG: hypothetical protein CFE23_05805 [Flavobacterium sp. BFFFF1]